MGEAVWWLVAALAASCAVLLVLLWRRSPGRTAADAGTRPRAAEPPSPVRDLRGGVDKPVAGGGLAPLPGPSAPPRSPVAALVAPPTVRPPMTLVAARVRRFELRDARSQPVMTLERASATQWRQAAESAATPVQREALAAALMHAPLLATLPAGEDGGLFCFTLRAGSAIALARGELAGAPGGLRAVPPQSLDPSRAAALAGLLLALACGPVYLRGLRRDVAAIQADAAGWLRRSSPGDEKLRTLMQDLSRYLREVEENHAGAIRKPVFVARVAEFCTQAEQQWRSASDAVAAQRRRLEASLVAAPEAGALAECREPWQDYALRLDVARCAARVLAAWQGLRLALGEASPDAAVQMRSVLQSLRVADEADRALARAAQAAGVDEGRSLSPAAAQRALGDVAARLQALEAGFACEAEFSVMVQLEAGGRVRAVRLPATE